MGLLSLEEEMIVLQRRFSNWFCNDAPATSPCTHTHTHTHNTRSEDELIYTMLFQHTKQNFRARDCLVIVQYLLAQGHGDPKRAAILRFTGIFSWGPTGSRIDQGVPPYTPVDPKNIRISPDLNVSGPDKKSLKISAEENKK